MATPVIFPVIIVKQYERMVPFRLGKFFGIKGAGLRLLIPFIDSFSKVDLREDVIDVARQTNITRDNAPIDIDFLIYYKVVDHEAEKSVLEVQDFRAAIVGMATTTLRAVVGDIPLDDVLAKREEINQILRVKLDEVTEPLGRKGHRGRDPGNRPPRRDPARHESPDGRREGTPGRRDRGRRSASRPTSPSPRARSRPLSSTPRANGSPQILQAEGHRQAAILNAEGFSNALDQIYKHCPGRRLQDHEPPVLRDPEGASGPALPPSSSSPWSSPDVLKPFMNLASSGQEDGSNGT